MKVAGWAKRGEEKPSRGWGWSELLIGALLLTKALFDSCDGSGHVDGSGQNGPQRFRHLLEALRHGDHGEAGRVQARRHLVPGERAGGGSAGQGAQGKRPHDGLAVTILTEV